MCAWWNLYIQRVNGCCCFFVVRGVWTALVKTWEIECFLTKAVISFMSLFIAGLRAAIRMSCQSLQCTQTSRNADRTNRQKKWFPDSFWSAKRFRLKRAGCRLEILMSSWCPWIIFFFSQTQLFCDNHFWSPLHVFVYSSRLPQSEKFGLLPTNNVAHELVRF